VLVKTMLPAVATRPAVATASAPSSAAPARHRHHLREGTSERGRIWNSEKSAVGEGNAAPHTLFWSSRKP
jgi:hypothetical protein